MACNLVTNRIFGTTQVPFGTIIKWQLSVLSKTVAALIDWRVCYLFGIQFICIRSLGVILSF